jgi:hypothetical protein
MLLQVVSQCLNELSNHSGWQNNPSGNLLRLLHAKQKIHNEFMLALQHHSSCAEHSPSNMSRNQCPHMTVTDFLTLWFVAGNITGIGLICHEPCVSINLTAGN